MDRSFSIEEGRNGGVYFIIHNPSGKLYVGSAVCFNRRFLAHINDFRNKRNSPYLQRFYDKNKTADFCMKIIECADKNNLIVAEQKWIDKYFDKQNNCFNISPTAGNCIGVVPSIEKKQVLSKAHKALWETKEYKEKMLELASLKRKQYRLLSPDGVVYEGVGIESFCNENDLHVSHIGEVLMGKIKSHNGWRLPENQNYNFELKEHCKSIGQKRATILDVRLQAPNGEIFGPICNIKDFCRKHNLHRVSIRKLAKKEIKQTKGWVLYNE